MMCVLFRIMCICCRQEEKISGGNIDSSNTQRANATAVTVPPTPTLRSRVPPTPGHPLTPECSIPPDECFVEEERTSSPSELCLEDNTAIKTSPSPQQKYPKLQDYGSSEDLKQLTIKEMKILLTLNRVDFKGCIERSDLLDKLDRLWRDSNQHKGSEEGGNFVFPEGNEDYCPDEALEGSRWAKKAVRCTPENIPTEELCKLCMDAPLDCVLLECGHIASCVECGKRLAECPICRQYVVRVVRTFKA